MRNFHKVPEPGATGEVVGITEGDGYGSMLTLHPGGVTMVPVYPAYERDETGSVKHQYKLIRSRATSRVHQAGRI